MITSSLSLLFTRLNSLSPLSLSFYFRCFRHLIAFMTLCWTCSRTSMSRLYWEPRSGPSTLSVLSPVLIRGTRISAGITLPNAAQELLDHFATGTHCWSMVSLSSRTPVFSLAKLLSSHFFPGLAFSETSWKSSLSSSPACSGPFGWQHNHLTVPPIAYLLKKAHSQVLLY